MKKLLPTLILTFFYLTAFPQTGALNGKIESAETGLPLSGVSVSTEEKPINSISDSLGNFNLILKAGKSYRLKFTMSGYQPKEIAHFQVATGEEKTLTIKMDIAFKMQEEVIIRQSARKLETTAALIRLQKNTAVVSQVISAESIRRSPDKNTSEILRRVPGISIQEGKYIIVRGLNDRYNQTMVNGILMGTTEADRKAFSYDIFPAGIIDNIVINKSFSPEFSGEWAGGMVQVNTNDIPVTDFLRISVGTGFNTQTVRDDFYSYKGGKLDWIGIDDGSRNLPNDFPSKEVFSNLDRTQKTAIGKELNSIWTSENDPAGFVSALSKSFQVNGGFRKELGSEAQLGAVFSVNYNQSAKRTDNLINRLFTVQTDIPDITYDYQSKKYSRDVLWGGLANFTLSLRNNKIHFRNLFNVNATNYLNERQGKDFDFLPGTGANIRSSELALKTNIFLNTSLAGEHDLKGINAKINWFGNFNILDQKTPDQRRIEYVQDPGKQDDPYKLLVGASQSSQKSGSRYFGTLSDYNYTAGTGIAKTYRTGEQTQIIKAGYQLQIKDRLFDSRPFAIYLPSDNPDLIRLPANEVFSSDHFGDGYNNLFAFNEITGSQYHYIAYSVLNAAYLQSENIFFKKLKAVYGLRVENNDQIMGSYDKSDPKHVQTKTTDVLPAVNLTWQANKKTNLRLSGSRTVIRPEFRELSDFAFYDFELGATVTGNSNLSQTDVTNLDLRYEYYPSSGELVTVGVFYKYFSNPIELFYNPASGGASTFNYINADKANSYGAELEIRKKMDFIESLKNFVIQVNTSYIYNRVSRKDANLFRPMQGQSPYVINASVQYDLPKPAISATLLFNQIGDRIFYVGGNDFPPVTERHRPLLDLQLTKKILGKTGELKLNFSDIFDRANVFYLDIDQDRKFDAQTDVISMKRKYGTTVSVSFSYNIK